MGPKSTLRLIRTLGPSLASLAQSTWSFSIQCPCGVGLHHLAYERTQVWACEIMLSLVMRMPNAYITRNIITPEEDSIYKLTPNSDKQSMNNK